MIATHSRIVFRIFVFAAVVLSASQIVLRAQGQERATRIAVLDFGGGPTGSRVAEQLGAKLRSTARADNPTTPAFQILDRDLSRAAALGAGYGGSLNLTLSEAQNLGTTIGCDFFFAGEAQTLRRSPSTGAAYFEAYAAVYLVSGRTGRLASWERPAAKRSSAQEAEDALLQELTGDALIFRYQRDIKRSLEDERAARAEATSAGVPVLQLLSDESSETNSDVRAPKPFRRLKPPYPETAARAEVEAIVDVLVDIDAQGEVQRVEVYRWAGYGLDQSVVDTVKQLHFFPAMRDGVALPIRVLLRYNFRKPPPETRTQ